MILACRLLPRRANRVANIVAGSIVTLVNGFLTFIPPLVGRGRPPALPEYRRRGRRQHLALAAGGDAVGVESAPHRRTIRG